jgi:hypothetical protein
MDKGVDIGDTSPTKQPLKRQKEARSACDDRSLDAGLRYGVAKH